MKLLALLIIALAGAIAATRVVQQDAGIAVLSWGEYTLETSVAVLAMAVITLFILLYVVIRLVLWLRHLPGRMRRHRVARRQEQSRNDLATGLLLLQEGKPADSEKHLLRHVGNSATAVPHYLLAARAAQSQGAYQRRDNYLFNAQQISPVDRTAIALAHAGMQLEHQQTEQALATLLRLQSEAPRHPEVLKLLARTYEERESWDELHALLPQLRKLKLYDKQGFDALVSRTALHRLANTESRVVLEEQWNDLPKSQRNQPALVAVYVDKLVVLDAEQKAIEVLRRVLQQQWDDNLVERYGLLSSDNRAAQITHAERWLKQRPHDARLLMALGRLCLKSQLWGKARGYLEASLAEQPEPEGYRLLAQLLEQMGETDAACRSYRQGFETAFPRHQEQIKQLENQSIRETTPQSSA